jgi:hypothetical protein
MRNINLLLPLNGAFRFKKHEMVLKGPANVPQTPAGQVLRWLLPVCSPRKDNIQHLFRSNSYYGPNAISTTCCIVGSKTMRKPAMCSVTEYVTSRFNSAKSLHRFLYERKSKRVITLCHPCQIDRAATSNVDPQAQQLRELHHIHWRHCHHYCCRLEILFQPC